MDTLDYYSHPYVFYKEGSNERFNRLIRRFIPKTTRIDSSLLKEIANIET